MSQDSRASSAGFFLAGAVVGKAKEAGKNFEEIKKDIEPKLRKAKKDITGQLSK
jgi:hypothetical protein